MLRDTPSAPGKYHPPPPGWGRGWGAGRMGEAPELSRGAGC